MIEQRLGVRDLDYPDANPDISMDFTCNSGKPFGGRWKWDPQSRLQELWGEELWQTIPHTTSYCLQKKARKISVCGVQLTSVNALLEYFVLTCKMETITLPYHTDSRVNMREDFKRPLCSCTYIYTLQTLPGPTVHQLVHNSAARYYVKGVRV